MTRSCFFAFSRTATVSPALTRYDAMLTTSPLTVIALVRDQLARFGARRAEAHAVDDVVEARLEQRQQVRAGVALAALGFGEVAAELALEHAVHALDLLLLAQLQAEVGRARAGGAAVLAGLASRTSPCRRSGARALFRNRSVRFTAGKLGLGAEITCHVVSFLDRSDAARSFEELRASLASVVAGRSDGGLHY